MLKFVLIGSAMVLSEPAVAQNGAAAGQTTTATDPAAPTAQTQAAPQSPVDSAMAGPATTAAQSTTATPAAGETVTGASAVAQVVESEFPTYDKDANGALSKTEFGAWMVALKTASDPSTKAASAATKTWVGQSFTAADADKSASVSKAELAGFLGKAS